MHSKLNASDASGSRQDKTMNTTIALDEIRLIGAWTPIDVDALAVACAAIDAAMRCVDAVAMKDAILRTLRDGRIKFFDEDHAMMKAWDAAVLLMGLRKYNGNEALSRDYRVGYFHFVDACGSECDPMSGNDVQAWEAGRADNPDYAVHLSAKAAADKALNAKFGANSGTRKGYIYWLNQYCKFKAQA